MLAAPIANALKNKQGFTVAELLFVIAIMSVLISIVFSSAVATAKESAKTAKSRIVEKYVHEVLGPDSKGNWYFDNNLTDSSGNNLTLSGINYSFVSNGITGKAVRLDVNGSLSRGSSSLLYSKTGSYTVGFWVKREWNTTEDFKVTKPNTFYIWYVDGYLAFMVYEYYWYSGNGLQCSISVPVNILDGRWHYILMTYDGSTNNTYSGTLKGYIDGDEVVSSVPGLCAGAIRNSSYNLRVDAINFQGFIENLRIYDGSFLRY